MHPPRGADLEASCPSDGLTISTPNPWGGIDIVDTVAVHRALSGERVPLTRAERTYLYEIIARITEDMTNQDIEDLYKILAHAGYSRLNTHRAITRHRKKRN